MESLSACCSSTIDTIEAHPKWCGVALLVTSVVVFGTAAAIGGMGLYNPSLLPSFLLLGHTANVVLFVSGISLGVVGLASSVFLFRKEPAAQDDGLERRLVDFFHAFTCGVPLPYGPDVYLTANRDLINVPYNGKTILYTLVERCQNTHVAALIAAGAKVDVKDSGGTPLLYKAVDVGNTVAVGLILEKIDNIRTQIPEGGGIRHSSYPCT